MVRKYWKFSEGLSVKYADLVVCDSKAIENYIKDEYSQYNPKTEFIAYGSYIKPSTLSDDDKDRSRLVWPNYELCGYLHRRGSYSISFCSHNAL